MRYRTIVLGLLEQQPELHESLRAKRTLLATMDRYALELKANHEAWMDHLSQTKPGSDPSQFSSEAMEIALKELKEDLSFASATDEEEPSLDGAMAYLHRHTPNA